MATASSRRTGNAMNRGSQAKKAKQASLPAASSHSVTKRLQNDLGTLMIKPVEGVSAFPSGDNLFHWTATIVGGKDTPYEDLKYKMSLEFPDKYPHEPPKVKFTSPCFHPNVDDKGNICLDTLKDSWSALLDVKTVLLSIQSLLGEPNNDSPLNIYAAALWENQSEYKATVRRKYEKDVRPTLNE